MARTLFSPRLCISVVLLVFRRNARDLAYPAPWCENPGWYNGISRSAQQHLVAQGNAGVFEKPRYIADQDEEILGLVYDPSCYGGSSVSYHLVYREQIENGELRET